MNNPDQLELFSIPNIEFIRCFSMPSMHTFTMQPVKNLLRLYVQDYELWADPFAGYNSPAIETNDLNPECPSKYHMKAEEFSKEFEDETIDGILFDPPYSPRQISECYKSIGLPVGMKDTQNGRLYKSVKDSFVPKIVMGGIAICFGWNSQGFGITRGFKLEKIMLVSHGGAHNDTIVTIERKL